ncbi:MAG: T9SS type A sorting domain-containing protein, partial [Bacteroidales bacterium]|nr:T9SS type A sorting domain-containing protein [Bacteroidales bacterium]
IMDSDGSISSANVKWGTSSGSYPNTISMSNSGDDYSATIPSQSGGTNVYYLIEATDNNAKAETFYSYYEVSESSGIKQFAYNNLKIYPNPATDIINIVFSDGSKTETIKLFNLIGEKVLEASDINSSEVSVNLNQFAKGIYFLQIDNGYNRIVKKVMLE